SVAVTQFTIAVDRPFQKDEADFIPVVIWRQLAETVANYVRKGRLVAVEGRWQTRHYENSEGKRVYVNECIADNVRFLESSRTSESAEGTNTPTGNSNANTGTSAPSDRTYVRNDVDPFKDDGRPLDISEDSLPF